MQMLPFQEKAVLGEDGLVKTFKKLWATNNRNINLTFKSPTGSGKTFMVCNFLHHLQNDPEFGADVAFVWITFSDELAMQSRDKFTDYFFPNVGRNLLTIADFSQGVLQRDDVLFLNWQKLVAKDAEKRLLRRPEKEELQKEQGFYFEDVVEKTFAEGREIVMIIDESHKNVTAAAYRDVINPLKPRILLNVSATPEQIPNASEVNNLQAGFVEVLRKDVVAEGLIKEQIASQTEEDLKAIEGEDLDFTLLRLAKEKRESIAEQWKKLGLNINPLVLIQLPDDDSKLKDQGVETKEEVVTRFLTEKFNVPDNKIARWFDKKKEKLEHIAELNDSVEFMLFKYAAGTGWDCPRAHIIVMFREIESATFKTQTLGRILRNPVPGTDLSAYPDLRQGFLYTNYRKNEISDIPDTVENKPKTEVTNIASHLLHNFAVKETANNVVQDLREQILSDLVGIEPSKSVASIAPEIENALHEAVKQVAPELSNKSEFVAEKNASDLFGETDLKAAIAQKQEKIVEAAIKKVKSVLTEHFGTSAANKATEIVADASRDFAEALIQQQPSSFIIDPLLKSDFISRADYGDIGKASAFQSSFVKSMNRYFGIDDNSFNNPFAQQGILEKFGIDTTQTLSDEVLANATFAETNDLGKNVQHEMSDNEVEKIFMNACYKILEEQTEPEAKYGNLARSWGPFKEALRQWFDRYSMTSIDNVGRYKIFLKDLFKNSASKFRPAITQALKDYKPIRDAFVAERRKQELQEAMPFKVKTSYAYSSEYKDYRPSAKSMLQPFKLKEDYPGRDNEISFIEFLENTPTVEWWFKQNDEGKDFYSLKYFNTTEKRERLFYPDWIVKYMDGRIGIFDTKSGFTAANPEGRAEALTKKLRDLNALAGMEKFVGGLCVQENGSWYYNDSESYAYKNANGNLAEGWKVMLG